MCTVRTPIIYSCCHCCCHPAAAGAAAASPGALWHERPCSCPVTPPLFPTCVCFSGGQPKPLTCSTCHAYTMTPHLVRVQATRSFPTTSWWTTGASPAGTRACRRCRQTSCRPSAPRPQISRCPPACCVQLLLLLCCTCRRGGAFVDQRQPWEAREAARRGHGRSRRTPWCRRSALCDTQAQCVATHHAGAPRAARLLRGVGCPSAGRASSWAGVSPPGPSPAPPPFPPWQAERGYPPASPNSANLSLCSKHVSVPCLPVVWLPGGYTSGARCARRLPHPISHASHAPPSTPRRWASGLAAWRSLWSSPSKTTQTCQTRNRHGRCAARAVGYPLNSPGLKGSCIALSALPATAWGGGTGEHRLWWEGVGGVGALGPCKALRWVVHARAACSGPSSHHLSAGLEPGAQHAAGCSNAGCCAGGGAAAALASRRPSAAVGRRGGTCSMWLGAAMLHAVLTAAPWLRWASQADASSMCRAAEAQV